MSAVCSYCSNRCQVIYCCHFPIKNCASFHYISWSEFGGQSLFHLQSRNDLHGVRKLWWIFVILKNYIKSSILKQNRIQNIDVPFYSEHQFSLYVFFLKCHILQLHCTWAQPDLNFCHSLPGEYVLLSHDFGRNSIAIVWCVLLFAGFLRNSNYSRPQTAWYYSFVWGGNLFSTSLLCLPFKYWGGN